MFVPAHFYVHVILYMYYTLTLTEPQTYTVYNTHTLFQERRVTHVHTFTPPIMWYMYIHDCMYMYACEHIDNV